MKYILIIILVIATIDCRAQCAGKWKFYDGGNGTIRDTTSHFMQFFENAAAKVKVIDFESLVKQIRIPRLHPAHIEELQKQVKQLATINTDSARREIDYLKNEIESQFQILTTSDGVEYALYRIDTVHVKNRRHPVYIFSTDMQGRWNEDFDNYMFYYTPAYGVLYAKYTSVWGYSNPVAVMLIDNCRFSGKKSDVRVILKQCRGPLLWKD
jgi:hypothetical protein